MALLYITKVVWAMSLQKMHLFVSSLADVMPESIVISVPIISKINIKVPNNWYTSSSF